MICGSSTSHMVGIRFGISLCSSKIKSQEYLSIQGDHVQPSMDFYSPDGSDIFQEDNGHIHRAHVVQELFRDHEGSFSHFIERSFTTFARTLDKYSFRLFVKSCIIYA